MDIIIEGLFYGKIQEEMSKASPSSNQTMSEVSDNYDKLIALLNKEQIKALQNFTGALEESHLINIEHHFKQGFKYGCKIIMEVLENVHS